MIDFLGLLFGQGPWAMQISEVIDQRRSIRAFRATPIEEGKVNAILAASQDAPSAGDLQAYKIVVVTDAEMRALLAKAALGQDFVAEAPVVLVFFADTRRSKGKYGSRGAELFCLQDATIAAVRFGARGRTRAACTSEVSPGCSGRTATGLSAMLPR